MRVSKHKTAGESGGIHLSALALRLNCSSNTLTTPTGDAPALQIEGSTEGDWFGTRIHPSGNTCETGCIKRELEHVDKSHVQ
jgi:hypothetical protein